MRHRVQVPQGVVGFDMSIRRPAACFIPGDWKIGDWDELGFASCDNRKQDLHEPADRWANLSMLSGWAWDFYARCRLSPKPSNGFTPHPAAFVEGYAMGLMSSSVTRLAELGGVMRVDFWRRSVVVKPLVVFQARQLLLGTPGKRLPKGAKKVVEAQLRKHGAPFTNDDEADAFCIANLGRSELGMPFLSLA